MTPNNEEEAAVAKSATTYRAAMSLNNLGVSMMMEQGPLPRAIRLFKDSVAVMSVEHCIPSVGEFGDVFLPISQEQEPSSARCRTSNVPSLHPFEICPCDDGDLVFQTSTLFSGNKFVPIHLRSHHFYEQQGGSHDSANLALAIVLYNHGLAQLLAHVEDTRYASSMGFSSTQHGLKHLRGAYVALHCSQVMIDRYLNVIDMSENGCYQKEFEKLGGSIVSAMTLKAMMWMSRLDSHHGNHHAEQASAMFLQVLADIDYYQYQLRKLNVDMCQHPASTATAA
jgi:hypothetical protein